MLSRNILPPQSLFWEKTEPLVPKENLLFSVDWVVPSTSFCEAVNLFTSLCFGPFLMLAAQRVMVAGHGVSLAEH